MRRMGGSRAWGQAGHWALVCVLAMVALGLDLARAQGTASPYSSTQMSPYPPNINTVGGAPMMMLTSSRDHTLFSPIYTDFEDINGDGVMDTTYLPGNRYYGYFEPDKCYAYNGARNRFEPKVNATSALTCPGVANGNGVQKPAYWLGNFLNWATMTRIDVVRKMLYGGMRAEDTATDTTLQMAHMSQDAHSFVKYYGGDDIGNFTPFSNNDLGNQGLTICNRGSVNAEGVGAGVPIMRMAKGNYSLWATIPTKEVCRWSAGGDNDFFGEKTRAFYKQYSNFADDDHAHKTNYPKRNDGGNANDAALAPVVGGSPSPELQVRVQACVKTATLSPDRRCKAYTTVGTDGVTTSVLKPAGILQDFGTSSSADLAARVEFGLLSGSYDWNMRGGALRKNMGSINDEIDLATGRFCHNFGSTETKPANCKTQFADARGVMQEAGGIVATFDRMRLYEIGDYNVTAKAMGLFPDDKKFVLPSNLKNGAFPSWGNPMSEMLVQSLYYLANRDMGNSSLFNGGGAARVVDSAVGLPAVSAVIDPFGDTKDIASGKSRKALYGRGICRPTNILAISSGSTNFDTDDGDSTAGAQSTSVYTGVSALTGSSIGVWTDRVGAIEGINGTSRSVGSVTSSFGLDSGNSATASCAVKGVVGLSGVAGICPDVPGIKGTYQGAGAAFYANTHFIRTDAERANSAALPSYAGRVKTYAASLAGGVGRIEVPVGNRTVVITPEASWDHGLSQIMPGAMLTFKAIGNEVKSAGDGKPATFVMSGSYVVTWNDTQFGGDYDMDMVGFLRWELYKLSDGSHRLDVLTDVLGHNAGAKGAHGYSIIGVDAANDRRYLTHGSNDMKNAVDTDCHDLDSTTLDYVLRCRFADGGMATTTVTPNPQRDRFVWPTKVSITVNGQEQKRDVNFIELAEADATGQTVSTTVRKSFSLPADAAATSPTTLRDPLWYMAKYGSFDTGETSFNAVSTAEPSDAQSTGAGANRNWDKLKNNGAACTGSNCADGEPDGYFLGRRPDLLEERLRNLFNGLNSNSNSAVAVSTVQLFTDSLKYVASFEDVGTVRNGTIDAYAVRADGEYESTPSWSEGDKLLPTNTSSAQRVVITNGQSGESANSQIGVALRTDALNNSLYKPTGSDVSTYMTSLGGGTGDAAQTLAANLIRYLRGEKDGLDGQIFVDRGDKRAMGTVVNSSPWLQNPATTAKFSEADFPSGTASYAVFARNRLQNNKVLWVGANDGLLHGFDALSGRPLLSYLPSPLVASLADALVVNRRDAVPLMDGSPFTGDVLRKSGSTDTAGTWRTYLFSSLGRGGKAVFALDVTDTGETGSTHATGDFSEGNAHNLFKWVFTAADNADLGHVLSEPVVHFSSGQASPVVRLNNGRFAVMVPNGVGAASGQGALFLLYVEGPGADGWQVNTDYKVLKDGVVTSDNGYMGATWVDLDNNGTADVLYATDLQGHVWKFDVRSADAQDWGAAFKLEDGTSKPFFEARSSTGQVLPITTAPVTTFPPFGGVMVSFGTGRAIDNGDLNGTLVHRFFSVWDAGHLAGDQVFPPESATDADGEPIAPRELPTTSNMEEVLLARDDNGRVYRYRLKEGGVREPIPSTDIASVFDPTDATKWGGWFFDFPLDGTASTGEQLVFSPITRSSYISFSTVRPLTTDETESSCTAAPKGTFYAFNPSTGRAVRGLLPTATPSADTSSTTYGLTTVSQRVKDVQDNTGISLDKKKGSACRPGEPNCVCDANGENCKIEGPCGCTTGKVCVRLLEQKPSSGETKGCVSLSNLRLQWRDITGMKTQ